MRQWASYPDFRDWQQRSRTLEQLTGWGTAEHTLAGAEPQRIRMGMATGGFFALLGGNPLLGTTARIDSPGAPTWQVVLSHALWERRFNSATDVIGQALTMGGERYRRWRCAS